MSEVITVAEMGHLYPDEWVLILDPDQGPDLKVRAGVVGGHGSDRDELYRQIDSLRPGRFAVYFMGDPIPPGELALL